MSRERENTKPKNSGVQEAIEKVGTQGALAALCGVATSTVAKWLWRACPPERALQIERATGVPRARIRPDIFS